MADRLDREGRSRLMAAIRSRGNQTTELRMVSLLRQHRLHGWRRHYKVIGTPDFAWPKLKVALFVDGCFWHCCPHCRKASKTNTEFWEVKLLGNRLRDARTRAHLRRQGWKVMRV